ncbi:thiamine phosphate synthase [Pseudocolwellia agarivorans]|uniref:thiamine phosphate synthase n=1 Tax=Pseudocolwellia agarivorans TaxID=1911682 RepID=UPI000987CAA9|nr:thiamine phosphate synthase [Pseudocolwellia agarivorans]
MTTSNKPIVWTISGSDCSGGAGIAADIKTGHALGVDVCHLSTANTVQNSQTLLSVNPVDVDILAQQAQLLLNDKMPNVIKIGLLANIEQVVWLTDFLMTLKQHHHSIKVVYDPVGHASVGGKFSNVSVAELTPLLNLIDVITPNSQEAQWLACLDHDNIKSLAECIISLGVNSVIIKGGHPLTKCVPTNISCFDYCLHTLTDDDSSKMSQDETIEYGLRSIKIDTDYSHGGGCSFASALAAFIAHGHLVRDAFTLAKAFINQGLSKNKGKHDHYGAFEQTTWPVQKKYFPVVSSATNDKYCELSAFKSLDFTRDPNNVGEKKLGLYPVIDSLYWLERLLPLGLHIIQLRVKNKTEAELDVIIAEAVALAKNYPDTRLFINDYWQLAIKHGAYGVHIGQEDLQTTPLDQIHKAGIRLGISTHGCYEFLLAQQLKPSYLAIGAIYPTKTKNMTGQIQGVENLVDILALSTDIPVVAIGGINHERAPEVLATGVDSIAVVSAITEAENPEASVALFQQMLE